MFDTYTKPEPSIEPENKSTEKGNEEIHSANSGLFRATVPAHYTKSDGTRELPTFIVIFSGGEARERDYFHLITRNKKRFPLIKVEFIDKSETEIPNPNPKLAIKANEGGVSPDKLFILANHWLQERYIAECDNEIEPIDSIYLISDVDHFRAEVLRIKPLCEAKGMTLIISNSCFEKWLYYCHFAERPDKRTEQCFICPDKAINISSAFKTYTNTVISGGINPRKAIFHLNSANANARANYKEDEDGIPMLYSTNMFLLGEKMLPLISADLMLLQAENEAKAEQFKNR